VTLLGASRNDEARLVIDAMPAYSDVTASSSARTSRAATTSATS
jgi:hypothetical protein